MRISVGEVVKYASGLPPPVFVSPDERIILIGSLLAYREVDCAIVYDDSDEMVGAVYGYDVINFLNEMEPEDAYRAIWAPLSAALTINKLRKITLKNCVRTAINEVIAERFGILAILDEEGYLVGLFSLPLLVRMIAERTERVGISVEAVSSPLKTVPSEITISDSLRFMMGNRIRRLVFPIGRDYYCLTDRDILKLIFSARGLRALKEDPRSLLRSPLLPHILEETHPIPRVSRDLDISEACRVALSSKTLSLVTEGERIVTPWDLVVKPFLADRLILA